MHRITLFDGEGDMRDMFAVARKSTLELELAYFLDSWDVHLRDEGGLMLESDTAVQVYLGAGNAPREWDLYSNDGDEFPLGTCILSPLPY